MKLIYNSCILILFVSCNHDPSSEHLIDREKWKEVITIIPDKVDKDFMFNASKLVKNLGYIHLKTPPGIFIGNIEDIICRNNRMYILDGKANSVFIFDDQGEHLATINYIGAGPGEYTQIDGFAVDKTKDNILIYCARLKKILTYDSNGKFLGAETINAIISSFSKSGGNQLYVYTGGFPNQQMFKKTFPKQERFFFMKNKKIVSSDLKFEYKEEILQFPKSKFNFYWFSDTLSLMESLGNTVYRVHETGTLSPAFLVNFGKANNSLAYEMSREQVRKIIHESQKNSKNWCRLTKIIENDNAMFLRYAFQGNSRLAVYSKQSKRVINLSTIWINDIDNISMPQIHASKADNSFIGSIDAIVFKRMVSSSTNPVPERIKKINETLSENDNPLIVTFSLADF